MSEVYAVRASHGEYSDRDEWIIAIYTDHEKAKEHVRLASEWLRTRKALMQEARRLEIEQRNWPAYRPRPARITWPSLKENPYSLGFVADDFWCSTVELLDEVPSAATPTR